MRYVVEIPEDGCENCPFHYQEYYWDEDEGGDYLNLCTLRHCPLNKEKDK